MSNKLPNDGKVARFHITLDRMRNIAYPPTFPRPINSGKKTLFGHIKKPLNLRIESTDTDRRSIVADITVVGNNNIKRNNIAFAQYPFQRTDAVDNLFIDRKASVTRKNLPPNLIKMTSAFRT